MNYSVPWWKAPHAAIYNRYLKTAGGGERSSLEAARALEDLGFRITFITDRGTRTSLERLSAIFKIQPKTQWAIKELDSDEIEEFCRTSNVMVFINHTFCSYIPSPVPCGVYFLMFPHQINAEQLEALRTYRAFLCNSPFTELYARIRWDRSLPLRIAVPPISTEHFRAAENTIVKKKLVLNVGRFNVDGHSKCQKEAIEAFIALQRKGVLDDEWRMVVVGHLNDGAENRAYFDQCAQLCPEKVLVKRDVSFDQLVSYYSEASALWQFTGVGLDYGVIPDRCEHLGLVAMDALCYGTIPVVYERSGAAMLMRWGESGYSFINQDDLAECMGWIARDFGTTAHHCHMRRCREQAMKFSYPHFKGQLQMALMQ